jgi:hypothetical protein
VGASSGSAASPGVRIGAWLQPVVPPPKQRFKISSDSSAAHRRVAGNRASVQDSFRGTWWGARHGTSTSWPTRCRPRACETTLLEDLRFEHLGRKVDEVVWHFAADCYLNQSEDHVSSFVQQHGRKVMNLVCYIPVENLKVTAETELFGIRLLPVSDSRIPLAWPRLPLESPVGCVAAVDVRGTSHERMAKERGRSPRMHFASCGWRSAST